MRRFREIADGVHVLRQPVLDVNCGLVVGDRRALLVDTLSTPEQAEELAAAVRRVTDLPVAAVNTHVHFDHTFGNKTVADALGVAEFWAHRRVVEAFSVDAERLRAEARRTCLELAPSIADAVAGARLLAPNRTVDSAVDLDLGGRRVRLRHPGPGHTAGDLAVLAGEATFAGDLLEEGAPPSVDDESDLVNWPKALDVLLPYMDGPVVPGHGAVVDAEFARRQRDELAEAARR